MKYLFIDTSSSFCTLAIIINDKIEFIHNNEIKSDMSSKIMPILDEGLNKCNISLQDINKIFVVNGPGSFTGVRIGVTIAKTIAWSLKIDVLPISSLEVIASTSTDKKYIIPMIDARRGNVFGAIYNNDLEIVKKEQLINIDQLLLDTDNNYELVSNDVKIDNIVKPNINLLKIIQKHEKEYGINPHNLIPNYLKLTEAEESKLKND